LQAPSDIADVAEQLRRRQNGEVGANRRGAEIALLRDLYRAKGGDSDAL
jgi:hypothetical protein